ncbi:DEAD/DEAH box helicase [Sporosarcina sp. YIM B06819]|uniref:DEAD/DEAH box helicase n=1 Tax=Sporosarcina sp. YIM B06819 TaxID=3081769 RepID=UPI00298D14FD|nr:ATP-binding domain-containing protein [Sporosarcina sp. YIM B06819]
MSGIKKHILSQSYYDDTASQSLVNILENQVPHLEKAVVYYQFPMLSELDEDLMFPSLMVISPNHGVFLFKTDSINRERDNELEGLSEDLIRIEELIFAKLIKSQNKKLKHGRRDLSFNLSSALFLPNYTDETEDSEVEIIKTPQELISFFSGNEQVLEEEVIEEIFAILDSSSAIIKPKERKVTKEDNTSKAYILKKLEEDIAVFDNQQKYAALSQLEGPQRIRGLAGSGKTIILCMKAAILHLRYPEKKILYTFMTKSLSDYIELLITRFYKVLGDGQLPDFKNSILIMHAWGGQRIRGVYYDTCRRNNVSPVTFKNAAAAAGSKNAFDYICKNLLEQTSGNLEEVYDYVLIDEAQDFKASFYQICRAIVKNDCIVWGYDDLQNIFDVTLQNTMTTFKNDYGAEGIDLVSLQRRYPDMDNDIVLPRSYRNPKEILVTAHALGFGIYNDILIQSLENNEHWEDLGYEVIEGEIVPDTYVEIERPLNNSPLSISAYCEPADIIKVFSAESFDKEIGWVTDSIEKAINEEGLRADDIIVISIDDKYCKSYFKSISELLYEKGIFTNNLSLGFNEQGFIEDEKVTLTTVYKAKGHEAAMVFVVGCDVFEHSKNERSMRNKIFTAFTRAKAWLRVSGISINNHSIVAEIGKVIENDFKLKFTHKESHVIQRDLDDEHIKKANLRDTMQRTYTELLSDGYSMDEIEIEMKKMFRSGSDES